MRTVEAIVENGELRMLDPLLVRDGTVVKVLVPDIQTNDTPSDDPRTPAEILAEIAAMPLENDEPFSGEDHDEVLYGWKKKK